LHRADDAVQASSIFDPWLGTPTAVRADLARANDAAIVARRVLAGASLLGIAAMTPVLLLQMGIVSHLPDPPLPRFHSDRVNRSKDAFAFRIPDGALAIAGFGLNIVLAAAGARRRAPFIPAFTMAQTGVAAAISAWYFSKMPRKEKAWCGYCIVAALASAVAFASTIPEGARATRRLLGRR
jgi:uncharacterized membrane protein